MFYKIIFDKFNNFIKTLNTFINNFKTTANMPRATENSNKKIELFSDTNRQFFLENN